MTPFLGASPERLTSWTLGRDGHYLTCALIREPSGTYVLRVRHEGRHILDERCDDPHQAVARTLEVFHVFLARGWLPEHARN
jgi:hypothetical protein